MSYVWVYVPFIPYAPMYAPMLPMPPMSLMSVFLKIIPGSTTLRYLPDAFISNCNTPR